MPESQQNQTGQTHSSNVKGIGFGLFLLLAGIALLAERMGWLPAGTEWFFPAVLIAWGASELYQSLGRR